MARRYSTAVRAQQTATTRVAILDAAEALFLAQGYLATTVAQVAAAAAVSVQSVYNIAGGKALLLKAVYDRTLAGDDEPIPMAQRPGIARMLAAEQPGSAIAAYAALHRTLTERTLPLLTMVLAQAATGDPALRAFTETAERERAIGAAATVHHLATRFRLRPGLDEQSAADVLWTLSAPELAARLLRRGWNWDRVEPWLADTLTDALIGPTGS